MKNVLPLLLLALALWSCQEAAPTQSDPELSIEEAGVPEPRIYATKEELAKQRFLVVLKSDSRELPEQAAAVLARVAARMPDSRPHTLHLYHKAFRGMAVSGPSEMQALLRADPGVYAVYEDQVVYADAKPAQPGKPKKSSSSMAYSSSAILYSSSAASSSSLYSSASTQVIPWGIERIKGPSKADTYLGIAFIIDTGIDSDHEDLNVSTEGTSCVDAEPTPEDLNGHGTHVAGIVGALDNGRFTVGVVPGVLVVPVKVLDQTGSGYMSDVIWGVEYAATHANPSGNDVANMSLSGGINTLLDAAVTNASTYVRFTLSAGNAAKPAVLYSPARVDREGRVFTISAMGLNDVFASFSNYGNPPVDYAAPGVSVLSLYKGNTTATMSGTSMSAPHFAGILLHPYGYTTDGTVSQDKDLIADPIAVLMPKPNE